VTDAGDATIRFRPLDREDFVMLSAWLASAHVAAWWRDPSDLETIESEYGPAIDGKDPTEVFVVERYGEPIGLIQRYLVSDNPTYGHALEPAATPGDAAGIDYLIGDEHLLGKGIGSEMIDLFCEETFARYRDCSVLTVAVQQVNRRSWRALEKAGFVRRWAGMFDSGHPSDEGPSFVYVRYRGGPEEPEEPEEPEDRES